MDKEEMTDEDEKALSLIDELNGYERLGEPDKAEKSAAWKIAIGLQRTDGLTPSDYLIETAKQNIDGHITFDEVKERLDSYYISRPIGPEDKDRVEEADKVSARIAEILSRGAFVFSPAEYMAIHKILFMGIYGHAGKIRNYNISKPEWVLDGGTVSYADASSIRATLDYDFSQEKNYHYGGHSREEIVEHIARFISGIWQIHPFGEGNTRTTAVFAIKYLRKLGFDVTNDMFAEHSWYFRNALVRANYTDFENGIPSTYEFLDRFFGNLLLGEKNVLRNKDMHISVDKTNGAENKAQNKAQKMTETEAAVKNFLKEHPDATQTEAATAIGISRRTVQTIISSLKEKGIIERDGSKKTGEWIVKGN
jgi:fido (protein-threonine AMPylation protein)